MGSIKPAAKSTAKPAKRAPVGVHHHISVGEPSTHRFKVTLTVDQPAAEQRLSLPTWIPGSYLIREFAKHLSHLVAQQGGRAAPVRQLDKTTWQVDCKPGEPLTVTYEVYAFDNSVRTAWLGAERGFFNATSTCLCVDGQTDAPQRLTVTASAALGWSLATGLTPEQVDRQGFGSYLAAHYDELADCPVEMGAFWSGSVTVHGVPHRFVVAGAPPAFDGKRLLKDTERIVDAVIRFWHPTQPAQHVPMKRYVFMLNAVDEGYGGLEHRNSTALICNRRDLPLLPEAALGGLSNAEGYTRLLGLICHEYFHTWNVKRLRPAEFARYDYVRENHTELLWFFEGFTSYYDDLLLRRAGLLDNAGYLKLLAQGINGLRQTPGRRVQTVAQSSFDAWTKYYRTDENTPNATVSYYIKGAMVALCLDLSLRQQGNNLDDAMRAVWHSTAGGPMTEADFVAAVHAATGVDVSKQLAAWVHSTDELPLAKLLTAHGVAVDAKPGSLVQRLGLRMNGSVVKNVLRGSPAEAAGFSAGDEWLAVNGWRVGKLEDLPLVLGKAKMLPVLVSRDKRIVTLNLANPLVAQPKADRAATDDWKLAVVDAAAADAWLNG